MPDEENDELIFCMAPPEQIKTNALWILFTFWRVKMHQSKTKIERSESQNLNIN